MENEDQYKQLPEAKYECLLFDLDDTLYSLSSGISLEITNNIQVYMREKLGIEEDKVPDLCISLYKDYGTTLAGLRAIGYNFDYNDFHCFVHGRLPYNMLKPDPVLRNFLLSLPVQKLIFTNVDKAHAIRAVNSLSTGLVLPKTPVVCKTSEQAFEEVFKSANINPKKLVLNLHKGKALGLHTVLALRIKGVDYAFESIHNIREAIPELWEADEKSKTIRYSGKVGIDTPVRAYLFRLTA